MSRQRIYLSLDHGQYKEFEQACREFAETSHTSVPGRYHKSIVLPLGTVEFEVHAPLVIVLPEDEAEGKAEREPR